MAVLNISLTGADNTRLMVLGENNVRFAMAKTLTQTAKEIQSETQKHIRTAFVLRRPNFEKSIKILPATKQNMSAKVYTMAGFAALQQTGGKQTAQSGRLAVPQYNNLRDIKAGRKSNPGGSFLLKSKSGGHVIAHRQNNEIRILYYLKNLAYVPKRLNMLEIGTDLARQRVPILFHENLSHIQ